MTVASAFGLDATLLSAPASASVPPSCVTTSLFDGSTYDRVTVTNRCSTGRRVKVVWAYDTDSPCYYLSPGGGFSSLRYYPIRFAGLQNC